MMLLVLWTAGLSLLVQSCLGIARDTRRGCREWNTVSGSADVCCKVCNPGNRMVKHCGPDPERLCTPCEADTYTADLTFVTSCKMCSQCVGALVLVKACTSSTDTVCGCKPGWRCGNFPCSFCVEKCPVGKEPAKNRSCRRCPEGTFNDQVHQPCKPWATRCPNPDEVIVAKGDAVSDIKCNKSAVRMEKTVKDNKPADGQTWVIVLCVAVTGMVLIIISTIIVVIAVKILWKGKKAKPAPKRSPIIRTPTDDPRTLIAVESSYHEAQQEQTRSSNSLESKDPKDQLVV